MKYSDEQNSINPLSIAVTGAVAGVAAMIFLNKGNRRRLKEMIDTFFETSGQTLDTLESKVEEAKSKGRQKLLQKTEELEEMSTEN